MHGGDIYRNSVIYDFSVNVNPFGIPESVRKAFFKGMEQLVHYPDVSSEALRNAIAHICGESITKEMVICGNGASELLMGIVHALMPRKALVIAPGFSGYEYALQAVDCDIIRWFARKETGFSYERNLIDMVAERKPDLILFANPSNPVGTVMNRPMLSALLDVCEMQGTYVVLDECFMEFVKDSSSLSLLPEIGTYKNLMILRAFTKSYAIPGIRLGYLICANLLMNDKIRKQLPEWNVSVPAQLAGMAALQETEYLWKTKTYIEEERGYLFQAIQEMGGVPYRSHANYLLFYLPEEYAQNINEDTSEQRKGNLYYALLKKKILIRDCSDYAGLAKGYYRIAVRTHGENMKLIEAMHEILGSCARE